MTDDTKPELDPAHRESLEGAHYGSQMFRWGQAGRALSERKRAELLAKIELNVLWDQLSEDDREKAVRDVAEDRDFPGLFDRLAAESAEADREADALQQAARDELAKTGEALAELARELAERQAQEEEERRKEAEATEATERKEQEADRKRLLQERERLVSTRDRMVKK